MSGQRNLVGLESNRIKLFLWIEFGTFPSHNKGKELTLVSLLIQEKETG